jgi:predicted RNase H-like HicB family nuclease
MNFELECEREEDGRWLAEVPQLPGVLAYGATADEAMSKAEVLALRVLADRLENGESRPHSISFNGQETDRVESHAQPGRLARFRLRIS